MVAIAIFASASCFHDHDMRHWPLLISYAVKPFHGRPRTPMALLRMISVRRSARIILLVGFLLVLYSIAARSITPDPYFERGGLGLFAHPRPDILKYVNPLIGTVNGGKREAFPLEAMHGMWLSRCSRSRLPRRHPALWYDEQY